MCYVKQEWDFLEVKEFGHRGTWKFYLQVKAVSFHSPHPTLYWVTIVPWPITALPFTEPGNCPGF
jgi:hypothetical protein